MSIAVSNDHNAGQTGKTSVPSSIRGGEETKRYRDVTLVERGLSARALNAY